MLQLLKKIPVDFGQANLKHTTKGKSIALSLVPTKPGESRHIKRTALDVGCRDGYYSEILKQKKYTVTSVDIECHYEKCRQVDANKPLPYPDNFFDLIWCSEVIEHLKDPRATLTEFRRILKSEGKAVLTTPNSKFWLYYILGLFGLTPQKVQNPTHLHFFGDFNCFAPSRMSSCNSFSP